MANQPDPAPHPSHPPVATIEHSNSQLEEFVERHRRRLLLIFAVLLILVIGFFALRYLEHSGASEAAGAFTAAESIEELRQVVANYPDDMVAGSAELLIADKLQEEGKEDESYNTLKSFVDTREGHPLYFKGVSDLGLKEHLRGNLDAAVELLSRAANAADAPGFIVEIALLRLGDALTAQGLAAIAADNFDQAQTHFDKAQIALEDLETRAGENSYLARTAKDRRERLPHLSVRTMSAALPPTEALPEVTDPLTPPPLPGDTGAAADNGQTPSVGTEEVGTEEDATPEDDSLSPPETVSPDADAADADTDDTTDAGNP